MKFETYKKICDSMGVHVGEVVWDENIKNILEQDFNKNSLMNEKFDKSDKEYVSDMIRDHLADMEISPCSFSYEIHVTYEEQN